MRKIGNYIAKLYPEILDTIIIELDTYASEYDPYEYGLPTHDEHEEFMKQIIIRALNKAHI